MSDAGPVSAAAAGAPTDEARRRGLRRMRSLALGLLLLAAVVYALTLGLSGGWGYVHAAAEASMVGAFADWFAVTALFRHPLGIPVPHTALIPARKDTLARSLQSFVTENFLSEAVVRRRIADAEISRRLGGWLREEGHSRRVVDEASVLLRAALARFDDDEASLLIQTELLPRLADEPLSAVAGRLLQEVVAEGAHRGLVDLAVTEGHRWLVDNPETVYRVLGSRAPWWTPQWLDERVMEKIHAESVAWLTEIRDDPDHSARHAIDDLLGKLADDLQHDPETMASAERLKQRVVSQPQVLAAATSLWSGVRRALNSALADPDSQLRRRALFRLCELGRQLVEDQALQARVDGYASDAAAFVVGRYGDELTTVITDTVRRWDGDETARRIELHVGRDLQFIRINGTLVGALAGLVIYAVTRLA
ncbi:MAG TPA: DUF445 domain-containing protein [Nocardioidaceae bacterium]|nr:DUF445 domain-containing protein [Nocardioidaceae bacterium]